MAEEAESRRGVWIVIAWIIIVLVFVFGSVAYVTLT